MVNSRGGSGDGVTVGVLSTTALGKTSVFSDSMTEPGEELHATKNNTKTTSHLIGYPDILLKNRLRRFFNRKN
jgi:hypothetical protein